MPDHKKRKAEDIPNGSATLIKKFSTVLNTSSTSSNENNNNHDEPAHVEHPEINYEEELNQAIQEHRYSTLEILLSKQHYYEDKINQLLASPIVKSNQITEELLLIYKTVFFEENESLNLHQKIKASLLSLEKQHKTFKHVERNENLMILGNYVAYIEQHSSMSFKTLSERLFPKRSAFPETIKHQMNLLKKILHQATLVNNETSSLQKKLK